MEVPILADRCVDFESDHLLRRHYYKLRPTDILHAGLVARL